ncbi:MAG: prolyl oligopeptidase family serine peptidase [Nitrospiraceae bacterium]|nr:prolyl oligopeptidase family serine peptidase [Nitrospiraceae bacterium]
MPKSRVELQTKTADEVQCAGYVRRRVNYFVDECERVSAWLFVPEEKEEIPAILCCHQKVPQGKDEPAGLEGEPVLALAQHYAELGYVTLAPDCITAGDRVSSGLDPFDTKQFYHDNPKKSALGKMLSDHIYAIDMLSEVKHVDSARIGVIGHGLGGRNALLLAAFDERVQVCVASCGFTRFAADTDPSRWVEDNGFAQMPLLRDAVKKGKFPFDWEHILAMAAPSPTLLITALNDELLPDGKSCQKALKLANNIYNLLGAQDALDIQTHNDGHRMTADSLQWADEWLERWI